jgi:hypothetical protein
LPWLIKTSPVYHRTPQCAASGRTSRVRRRHQGGTSITSLGLCQSNRCAANSGARSGRSACASARAVRLDPERAYGLQGYAVHFSSTTEDRTEGQRAFLEKRGPVFRGR